MNTWYIINIYYIDSLYRLLSWQHWWPEITFFSTVQVIHAKITNVSFCRCVFGQKRSTTNLCSAPFLTGSNRQWFRPQALAVPVRTAIVISAMEARALWIFLGYLAVLGLRLEMKMWKSKQPSFTVKFSFSILERVLLSEVKSRTKTCLQKLLYRCLLLIKHLEQTWNPQHKVNSKDGILKGLCVWSSLFQIILTTQIWIWQVQGTCKILHRWSESIV